jgi:4-nitrophenyl phosphatase
MNDLQIQTILLDMDGVLWRGHEPVLDIQGLFSAVHDLGCQVFCVTNNSTQTVAMYQQALMDFGVRLGEDRFLTSAVATADYLANAYPPGSKFFIIGEKGLHMTIQDQSLEIVSKRDESNVAAVVVGLDREMTYHKLNLAVQYILQGADFIGTNPDLTIPTPSGPAPGAGALIALIETSSGKTPRMIGKPAESLFRLALKRAGSAPNETLMIGDRLETDILGAQKLGIRNCIVLTGITTREAAQKWQPKPDRIADNALKIIEELIANDRELI